MAQTQLPATRPPGVAGLFYPRSSGDLAGTVDGFLAGEPVAGESPLALVAPHAGYDFSGRVAGAAFSRLSEDALEAVILVGPSHLESFDGVSIYPGGAYATPLGACPLHDEIVRSLLADPAGGIRAHAAGQWRVGSGRQEHALEVELPFLQRRLGGPVPIVPLIMGEQSWDSVEALGHALARALREETDPGRVLLVASSDLSHFHSAGEAEDLDAATVDLILGFDPGRLHEGLREGRGEACGGGPIAAVMIAAAGLGASGARRLAYTHSGRVAGNPKSVVGYAAVEMA